MVENVTTEQWAFCAGLGTGASVFIAGMMFGAAFLYVTLLWRSEKERRYRQKTWKEFADSAKAASNP